MTRALLLLACLLAGCQSPIPDRVGVGLTVDAETHELRTIQFNTYWPLKSDK